MYSFRTDQLCAMCSEFHSKNSPLPRLPRLPPSGTRKTPPSPPAGKIRLARCTCASNAFPRHWRKPDATLAKGSAMSLMVRALANCRSFLRARRCRSNRPHPARLEPLHGRVSQLPLLAAGLADFLRAPSKPKFWARRRGTAPRTSTHPLVFG